MGYINSRKFFFLHLTKFPLNVNSVPNEQFFGMMWIWIWNRKLRTKGLKIQIFTLASFFMVKWKSTHQFLIFLLRSHFVIDSGLIDIGLYSLALEGEFFSHEFRAGADLLRIRRHSPLLHSASAWAFIYLYALFLLFFCAGKLDHRPLCYRRSHLQNR